VASTDSTASSSGSGYCSLEEGTEKHLLRQQPTTTMRRSAAKDKPDGGDCGSYFEQASNFNIEEIAKAVASGVVAI